MKKNFEVVSHAEQLTSEQLENLMNKFSLSFSNIWLSGQWLSKEDYNYIISKAKNRKEQ